MEKCKKCGSEFTPQKGLISFCSLSCRNSRTMTEEIKNKISESINNSEKFKQAQIDKVRFIDYKKIAEKSKDTWNKRILDADFETLSFERLRKRIKLEQNNKCNKCGIDSWNGNPITLELEHKDGNHNNNERENLESLCPNCHSQTDTWRGRNKSNKRKKVSDDEIMKEYIKTNNIRQTLINVGLTPKGGNYNRIYRILKNA